MYEQRACFFFAWLIMPFNSRSTTLLRRIISQWFWLFLLSHALLFCVCGFFLLLLFCSLQNESWICTRGSAASWRMGWPIMSISGWHTDRTRGWGVWGGGWGPLLYMGLINLEDDLQFDLVEKEKTETSNFAHVCWCVSVHLLPGWWLFLWVGGSVP